MHKCCLVIIVTILSFSLFAAVDSTKTMNGRQFSALKDACYGEPESIDLVMKWMYDQMIADNTSRTWNSMIGALGTGDIEQDNKYLQAAADYVLSLNLDRQYFERRYASRQFSGCLNFGLDLKNMAFLVDMIWYHFADKPEIQQSLASQLERLAGWAYELTRPDMSSFDGVWAENNSNDSYPPKLLTWFHNGRIRMAGALGYAGSVLGNEEYIETAKYDLFDKPLTGGKFGCLNFMITNSGLYGEGMNYTEYTLKGLSNFFVARKRLTNGEDNLFNNKTVAGIYENSLKLISPDMSFVTFDDSYKTLIRSTPPYRDEAKYNFSHAIPYYYQSDICASEAREHIKWSINNYEQLTSGSYSREPHINLMFAYEESRNLGSGTLIPDHLSQGTYSDMELTILKRPITKYSDYVDYPVLYINHGNSAENIGHKDSDQSSFILYYKGIQLIIDPGYRPSWRSYEMAKNWLASPFAHNIIMVNPHHDYYDRIELSANDTLSEQHILKHFWDSYNENEYPEYRYWNSSFTEMNLLYKQFEPIGGSNLGYYNTEPLNPAHRNYLIINDSVTHLQIELDYEHPQRYYPEGSSSSAGLRNDVIKVKRNFYAIDLEGQNTYFIIYDELTSSDHNQQNEFMNQLHFALYPHEDNVEFPDQTDNLEYSNLNGIFTYTHFAFDEEGKEQIFLHGAMGAMRLYDDVLRYRVLDELPQGMYMSPVEQEWGAEFKPPQWLHRSMRIKSSTAGDDKFLTILIPSDRSDYYPVKYARDLNNGYGVRMIIEDEELITYAAVKESNEFSFRDTEIEFNTKADFFLIEATEDFTTMKKIILHGDNSLAVKFPAGHDYDKITIFESEDQFEEMIAGYKPEKRDLHVIIKPYSPLLEEYYPRYKILRSGVDPENFTAVSYITPNMIDCDNENHHHLGYHNHVKTFSSDDDYFYINY